MCTGRITGDPGFEAFRGGSPQIGSGSPRITCGCETTASLQKCSCRIADAACAASEDVGGVSSDGIGSAGLGTVAQGIPCGRVDQRIRTRRSRCSQDAEHRMLEGFGGDKDRGEHDSSERD